MLIAARKASTRSHMSPAPEVGRVQSSDSGGRKKGHALVGTLTKGTKLLGLHCSGSILIEELSELQEKKKANLSSQRDTERKTDRQTAFSCLHSHSSHTPHENIACTS